MTNQKSLKTLEFDKIASLLKDKAQTIYGKEKAKTLYPMIDLDAIKNAQQQTTDAVNMSLKKGYLPLGGAKDIRQSLKRVDLGGVLNIEELLGIGDFIYAVKKVIGYGKAENKDDVFVHIDHFFAQLENTKILGTEIEKTIQNETTIKDNASDALRSIRSSIKSAGSKIKEQLTTVINSQTYKAMLQDPVITLRNGRYCVPIKQEYKNSFPGMIHDQSSTGATVFMEPTSVVNLNNKIKELTHQEEEEINKILKKLSGLVATCHYILSHNVELITWLDFIFAKASLSLTMDATEPIFNTQGYINIIRGKHPLIDKEVVVPANIYLGKGFSTLLITGPNTGGKTVNLKTIGLFTLMGQAGLHVPASDKTELAIFDNVFADIGDEQSIEQSLSTFSSHMKNIVGILKEVTDNSLVLLDELGAGTDPTEGAALARALLEYFLDRQIRVAVTTHYSELKLYALTTKGVENAACEFNIETLAPTYKLLIGVPGKSNAFAISKKLGLEEHLIDAAKSILSNEDEKMEDLITDLEISKKMTQVERDRAAADRRDAANLKEEAKLQKEKLLAQKNKILEKAKEEARLILLEAKETADTVIKDITKKANNADIATLDKERKKLSQKVTELGLVTEKKKEPIALDKITIGNQVYIHSLGQRGVISTMPEGGFLTVKAGIMKIKVALDDISLDDTDEKLIKQSINHIATVKTAKAKSISAELDLRGYNLEEAMEKTYKYLDDAYLAALGQVRIVHGKGTGVLRTGIQKFLKNHVHVKSYREGVFGEGDSGVTVVELN